MEIKMVFSFQSRSNRMRLNWSYQSSSIL